MKPQAQKAEFIRLRAEGRSYSHIGKALDISKSTCSSWERELKAQIAELKGEQLNELYTAYYMTREARIKRLGETLKGINDTLGGVDLSAVPPEKLLDYKLKYIGALKEEFISTQPQTRLEGGLTAQDILTALGDLLNRVRAGDVSDKQAGREGYIIGSLLKAYDAVELRAKVDALEAIVGGRG